MSTQPQHIWKPETTLITGTRAAVSRSGHSQAAIIPTTPPIYLSATFHQESATQFGEYDYSRTANPTREALESRLALLENATRAFAYPSGIAAINAVAALLRPGDEVLASCDVYGGTYRLLSQVWEQRGIAIRYVDASDLNAVQRECTNKTRLIHAEALGNPMLSVCDVAGLAQVAHDFGALLSIDNTSLTPLNLRPLALGADIVVHSATKYLCGHSDVTAGIVLVRSEEIAHKLAFHHNAEGCVLPPLDSYLLLRGLETLGVRLERQQRSALVIAQRLSREAGIVRVRYPGLKAQPGADIHASQSSGHGAVISLETGDVTRSKQIVESLALFATRVSFGAVSSSASMPCFMSHKSVPEHLRAFAPPSDLLRLSIGLEDVEDLWADLQNALASKVLGGLA